MQAWRHATFLKKRLPHKSFSLNIAKSFRHYLQTEVKLNLSKVCKLSRVSEGATFSNTAQTRLLLCKFPDELHFWVTNFEIEHIFLVLLWQWVIYIPLCFKRNLFVKQNLLILLFNRVFWLSGPRPRPSYPTLIKCWLTWTEYNIIWRITAHHRLKLR